MLFTARHWAEWATGSLRKCHKKTKNVGVSVDSNLPQRRNAYKQNQNSHRGISAYIMAGARPSGAERQIRSESLGIRQFIREGGDGHVWGTDKNIQPHRHRSRTWPDAGRVRIQVDNRTSG